MISSNMTNRQLMSAQTGAESLKQVVVENGGIMEGILEGAAFEEDNSLAFIVLGGKVYGTNSDNVIRAAKAFVDLRESGDNDPVEIEISVKKSDKGREFLNVLVS